MRLNFQDLFEKLSLREKIILTTAITIVLWALWDMFFYQDIHNQKQQLKQSLLEVTQQISAEKLKAIQLNISAKINPNQQNHNQLKSLKVEYHQLKEELQQQDKKFIPPKLMAEALTDLLKEASDTRLIKLESFPASFLLNSEAPVYPIYKHQLAMTFTSSYLNTLNYLTALEALSWYFVIESIDYQVTDYPLAEVTLHVYTLSFEKGWLDV